MEFTVSITTVKVLDYNGTTRFRMSTSPYTCNSQLVIQLGEVCSTYLTGSLVSYGIRQIS